jgi:hypothetical protein
VGQHAQNEAAIRKTKSILVWVGAISELTAKPALDQPRALAKSQQLTNMWG